MSKQVQVFLTKKKGKKMEMSCLLYTMLRVMQCYIREG